MLVADIMACFKQIEKMKPFQSKILNQRAFLNNSQSCLTFHAMFNYSITESHNEVFNNSERNSISLYLYFEQIEKILPFQRELLGDLFKCFLQFWWKLYLSSKRLNINLTMRRKKMLFKRNYYVCCSCTMKTLYFLAIFFC